jgi:hypothetical protein
VNREKVIDNIMDFLYLISGFGSLSLSIFYSIRLFIYNGVNVICSITFATVYVVFLTLIFTQGIKLLIIAKAYKSKLELFTNLESKQYMIISKRKRQRSVTGISILIIWFFLVIYSIVATIGGQYDQLSKLEIDRETLTANTSHIPIINDQIKLLKDQQRLFSDEVNMIKTRLNTIQDIEKSYKYKNTSAKNEKRLDDLRDKITKNDQSIMEYKNQIIEIQISQNQIIEGSIYKYFQRITGISALIIQFILSFFPSIVIDFFAPISFSMFLYRKRR